MSETKTNFKNELKSAASLILTFSLPILHHYQIHQNAPCVIALAQATAVAQALELAQALARWQVVNLRGTQRVCLSDFLHTCECRQLV